MNTPKLQPFYSDVYKKWGFIVLEDWSFANANGGISTVPAGFFYDAGSIPSLFWQLTYSPYHPILLAPTLAHDWAYFSHCMSKQDADDTLYAMMMQLDASALKSGAIKKAVQVFGNSFYERDSVDFLYLSILRSQITNSGRGLAKYGL